MLGTILLVILILILIGALPTWPYSGSWGYYPSGGVGLSPIPTRGHLLSLCRGGRERGLFLWR